MMSKEEAGLSRRDLDPSELLAVVGGSDEGGSGNRPKLVRGPIMPDPRPPRRVPVFILHGNQEPVPPPADGYFVRVYRP